MIGAMVAEAAFAGDAARRRSVPGQPAVDLALGAQCAMSARPAPGRDHRFADGPHTLEVRVTDCAGNVGSQTPSARGRS